MIKQHEIESAIRNALRNRGIITEAAVIEHCVNAQRELRKRPQTAGMQITIAALREVVRSVQITHRI